jgi:peroxiredoxin
MKTTPSRRELLTVLASLALFPARAFGGRMARLRSGDVVPALSLKTAAGESMALAEQRGRVLLINFFASYCGPCQDELPLLVSLSAQLNRELKAAASKLSLQLLPIGVDERAADSVAMAQRLKVPAPVLLDPDGAARMAFDPQRYPCTFLIDATGIVRHINRGFGPGYRVRVEGWLRGLLSLPASGG